MAGLPANCYTLPLLSGPISCSHVNGLQSCALIPGTELLSPIQNVKMNIHVDIFHCTICYHSHTLVRLLPSTELLQTICFAAGNDVICATIKANGMSTSAEVTGQQDLIPRLWSVCKLCLCLSV